MSNAPVEFAPAENVTGRTAAGASTLIAARLFTRCIDMVTLFVLGRLLAPADFGLIAIAMTLILIVEAVMELPLIQALVRLPALTKAHLDTAFTIGLLRGLFLALILCLLAWPFARIYGDPRLIGLICALGIAPATRGLCSPGLAIFAKRLDFRRDFVIELSGKALALIVSVGLAWWTRSYWSLAIGTIVTPLTMAIVSYMLAPYAPHLSLKEWRVFSGFLGWMTGTQAINAFNWQMDQLLLGKFVSRVDLGHFSMASSLSLLPIQVLVVQVMRPLVSAFSLIKEDTERLAGAYRMSATTVVAVCIPAMVGMSVLAAPTIRLVLGPQWSDSAVSLQWLALAVIPPMFVAPAVPMAMVMDRTGIAFRLSVGEFAVKFPLMFIGAYYHGIAGVLLVRIMVALIVMFYSMMVVRGLVSISVRRQLFGPWRPMLGGVLMAAAMLPFHGWLGRLGDPLSLALGLAAVGALGGLVYALSVMGLWRLAGYPAGIEARIAPIAVNVPRRLLARFAR